MLTVACVYVENETYNFEWVRRLKRMVDRTIGCLHFPYRFVCISPENFCHFDMDGIQIVKPVIHPPKNVFPWWYKLNVFELPADRVLYFDLDVVILRGLSDLLSFPSDFVTAPSSGVPMRGHDFNSSVMMFDPTGDQVKLIRSKLKNVPFTSFKGDQQWLSSLPMRVDLFPSKWVQKYLPGQGVCRPDPATIVSLLIQGGKNQALIDAGHSWIAEYWK